MEEGVLAVAAFVGELLFGRTFYWTGYLVLKTVTLGRVQISEPNPIRNRFSYSEAGLNGVSARLSKLVGFLFWLLAIGVFITL